MMNLSDKKDFILICGISKKVSQGGNYKMILCNGPVVLTEDAGFVPEDRLIVTTVTTVAEVGPNRCNLGRSFNFCKNAKA